MIDRQLLVCRHTVRKTTMGYEAPMTVGNGEFAFTADVTGLQSFYTKQYDAGVPLCTMSQWGWHTSPFSPDDSICSHDQLELTEFEYAGRSVLYAVDRKPGNEKVYDWLRENPHKFNLGRISFLFKRNELHPDMIKNIDQQLILYEGLLESRFTIERYPCFVQTICHPEYDMLALHIESEALRLGLLSVCLSFPYGSPRIAASDWTAVDRHDSISSFKDSLLVVNRHLDHMCYQVLVHEDSQPLYCLVDNVSPHTYVLKSNGSNTLSLTFWFRPYIGMAENSGDRIISSFSETKAVCRRYWNQFWNQSGVVDFHKCTDKRAVELERRIILSQYLTAIQCSGSMPPQETGLLCNSWYGKFHLEMHPWHAAFFPLYNQPELLEKSLRWYQKIFPKAIQNASNNGFHGARWPKMTAYDGVDSPSTIATLLVWQQPHIILMCELLYSQKRNIDFLQSYWPLIESTANFMADFVVYEPSQNRYCLVPPLIPVQETYKPTDVKNPVFETEYWHFGLSIAVLWADRLGKTNEQQVLRWERIAKKMAMPSIRDGIYIPHENCHTWRDDNTDHPSVAGVLGLLPGNRIDFQIMKQTLDWIEVHWDFSTTWGWDFAMMAMSYTRLGCPEDALRVLLKETQSNTYMANGNNFQYQLSDLPTYLPGNGSLLLAVAMMVAGFSGCDIPTPGFPKDGSWNIEYEGIHPFPF